MKPNTSENSQSASTPFNAADYFPVPAPKEKPIPPAARRYSLKPGVAIPAQKGKQMLIVMAILRDSKTPISVKECAAQAAALGLHAVGGIEPSCNYHLNRFAKLGYLTVTQ